MRRLAIVEISADLLRDALHLPESVHIDQVTSDITRNTFLLRLEGPEFHEVRNGEVIQRTQALFHSELGHVEFIGWSHLHNPDISKT